MSLTASLYGDVFDTTVCSYIEWSTIHKTRPRPPLRCRECEEPMHAKVSKHGLRFFAHDRGQSNCGGDGEGPEHRAMKRLLADLIRSAGWEALLEEGPRSEDKGGWRADVLAVDRTSSRRVAFEVQLATMTEEEGRVRTDKYSTDGVETVWFTSRHTPWLFAVPGVRISGFDQERPCVPSVNRGFVSSEQGLHYGNTTIPLSSLVSGYLRASIVSRRINYLNDEYPFGTSTRSRFHSIATALLTTKDAALLDADQRRMEEELARENQRRANIEALNKRQANLLPEVVRTAERVKAVNEVVSVGIKTSFTYPDHWMPGHPAEGSERTAFGIPVWLKSTTGATRLFAVVCPVASRVSASLGWSWMKRGVLVYVADEHEFERVAGAIGRPEIVKVLTVPKPLADQTLGVSGQYNS